MSAYHAPQLPTTRLTLPIDILNSFFGSYTMPIRRDQYYRSVRERTPLLRRITEEPGAVIRGSISSALENLRHDEEAPISKTRGGFIIASIGLLIFLQGTEPTMHA